MYVVSWHRYLIAIKFGTKPTTEFVFKFVFDQMPRMLPAATKVALHQFFTTNSDRLKIRRWNHAQSLYEEFQQLGLPITVKYFKNALTKYRQTNNIQLQRAVNKYYKYQPRSATV